MRALGPSPRVSGRPFSGAPCHRHLRAPGGAHAGRGAGRLVAVAGERPDRRVLLLLARRSLRRRSAPRHRPRRSCRRAGAVGVRGPRGLRRSGRSCRADGQRAVRRAAGDVSGSRRDPRRTVRGRCRGRSHRTRRSSGRAPARRPERTSRVRGPRHPPDRPGASIGAGPASRPARAGATARRPRPKRLAARAPNTSRPARATDPAGPWQRHTKTGLDRSRSPGWGDAPWRARSRPGSAPAHSGAGGLICRLSAGSLRRACRST